MAIGTIEQAQQARQELASKNQKIIYQLPRELMVAGKPIKIFNVGPYKWEVSMGGMGQWVVQACEPGQPYSASLEIPFIMSEGIPTDMEHIEFRQSAGRSFAESVVGFGQHRHQTEDLRRFGVFIAAGDVPTEKELADAGAQVRARDLELLKEADQHYGNGPGAFINITQAHRNAADRLEAAGMELEERPWHKTIKKMADCPVCQQKVHPLAVVHIGPGGCGAVLNEAEVIKRKLRGYEHLWDTQSVDGAKNSGKGAQAR